MIRGLLNLSLLAPCVLRSVIFLPFVISVAAMQLQSVQLTLRLCVNFYFVRQSQWQCPPVRHFSFLHDLPGAEFIDPCLEDKVNPMPELTLSPSQWSMISATRFQSSIISVVFRTVKKFTRFFFGANLTVRIVCVCSVYCSISCLSFCHSVRVLTAIWLQT
jgi:hypothetical protein